MNFKQFLNEMPITHFDMRGDFSHDAKRQYGFNWQDSGILNNPKAVEKIHKSFSNTKQNFDLYFLRDKNAARYYEIGKVTPQWVQENLKVDIPANPDAITVIFTGNRAADKMPMNAWTIAHRMGHAFSNIEEFKTYFTQEVTRDFKEILKQIYKYEKRFNPFDNYSEEEQKVLRALAYALGTMKSARERNLVRFNEFLFELLAQYLITGHIQFNPLPRSFITKNKVAWGHPIPEKKYTQLKDDELKEWNEILKGHAQKYEYYLDSILTNFEGKIFVM